MGKTITLCIDICSRTVFIPRFGQPGADRENGMRLEHCTSTTAFRSEAPDMGRGQVHKVDKQLTGVRNITPIQDPIQEVGKQFLLHQPDHTALVSSPVLDS